MRRTGNRDDAKRLGNAASAGSRWAAAGAATGVAACLAPAADAYVGPGAGLGALGVVLAVIAAIFMALIGMILWPIRMIAHRRKAKRASGDDAASDKRRDRRDSSTGREAPGRT